MDHPLRLSNSSSIPIQPDESGGWGQKHPGPNCGNAPSSALFWANCAAEKEAML